MGRWERTARSQPYEYEGSNSVIIIMCNLQGRSENSIVTKVSRNGRNH